MYKTTVHGQIQLLAYLLAYLPIHLPHTYRLTYLPTHPAACLYASHLLSYLPTKLPYQSTHLPVCIATCILAPTRQPNTYLQLTYSPTNLPQTIQVLFRPIAYIPTNLPVHLCYLCACLPAYLYLPTYISHLSILQSINLSLPLPPYLLVHPPTYLYTHLLK